MAYARLPTDEHDVEKAGPPLFACPLPLDRVHRLAITVLRTQRYYITLFVLSFFTFALFFFPRASHGSDPLPVALPLQSCTIEPSVIDALELSQTFQYARFEIHPDFKKRGAQSPLGRTFTPVNLTLPVLQEFIHNNQSTTTFLLTNESCTATTALQLPAPAPRVDASHMTFGVATTITRLDASLEQFAHWAGHTGAKIKVIVPKITIPGVRKGMEARARSLGMDLTIHESELENHEDQYFTLVKAIYESRSDNSEWGVIFDDDAFFPSIRALVEYLAQYDATKPWYVGGLTEDMGQLRSFGYMAYGGGGVFLSMPLLASINKPEIFDKCMEAKAIGDGQVANCIYKYTLTKLTPSPLLHQLDLKGDVSGFYESGRTLPLSVHHWKSWHKLNTTNLGAVSSVCGDECLLRRWRFNETHLGKPAGKPWYFTNGFSLVQYGKDLDDDDISMEHTWTNEGDYRYSLEPLRPKDEKKVQFLIKAAWREDDGATVRQFYVHRTEHDIDRVMEFVWRRGHK